MQNAPVDTHESANITNLENVATLNAATSNIGEEYLEKVSTAEAGERPAAVMKLVPDVVVDCASVQIAAREKEVIPTVVHEDPPLDRVSTLRQMDVDETREGIVLSAHNTSELEGSPDASKFMVKSNNPGVPQVEVEFHRSGSCVEPHQVLSGIVDSPDPSLPKQLLDGAAKAEQNGTALVSERLLLTPVSVTDNISSPAGGTVARDTSSIPGISMLAGQSIPPAVYKHEEVVANKELFADALNKFHTILGTRITKKGRGGRERAAEVKTFQESIAGIPKLGGNDLDLHLLYVEVTSRGGLEQVIKDRKWKEVINCFKFPENTTSASYILRKYYVGLLYYFEQAYFFGKKGPLIPPPISMPGPSPMSVKRSNSAVDIASTPTEDQPGFKRTRKRKILPIQSMPVIDPAQSIGLTVRTTIEGKFEHGFLVSVTVGTEKMRGVLYHVPAMQRAPQHAYIPNYPATLGAEPIITREEFSRRGLKRKRRRTDDMPKKDPNAPRPHRTGYNFFFAEQRARLKALHPEKDKELSRMIGDAWNNLTEEEKTLYQDRGVQDKERYKTELREYLELLKSQNGKIPKELAAEHDPEEEKGTLKEAVVDAAIDVAVDVAVNNAVNVSVDDVVDVTTKAVTDATVGNHTLAAATSDHVAADDTGKAVTDAIHVSADRDATNGSYDPDASVDVEDGTANTVITNTSTVTTIRNTDPPAAMNTEDCMANSVSSPSGEALDEPASMDVDTEPQHPKLDTSIS